jgi:glucose-6-phosphate 1-epimerase
MTTNEINLSGRVRFTDGQGGLPRINVETEWCSAEIHLHGAHVTGFQKKSEAPLLFLSEASHFEAAKPIRGGIPVIFPWFGPKPGQPTHGYARLKDWSLKEIIHLKDGAVGLRFQLPESSEAAGYAAASVDYLVTLKDTLSLELTITNQSAKEELAFEDCLHTYFNVGEIAAVSISGLKGVDYLDKTENFAMKHESSDAITISSEVDRVYMDTTSPVEIRDTSLRRKIIVQKEGSASTVVWNPWIAKAKEMADFGDEEYQRMVCVESGNVGKNKISLAPGKSASLKAIISTVPL